MKDGRWEIRRLDGPANTYFVVTCIVDAGMLGLSAAPSTAPPSHTHDQTVVSATKHEDVVLAEGDKRPQQLVQQGHKWSDPPLNPSTFDDWGGTKCRITRRMARSFDGAFHKLKVGGELNEAWGSETFRDHLTMNDHGQDMLDSIDGVEGRDWLIERY